MLPTEWDIQAEAGSDMGDTLLQGRSNDSDVVELQHR
jgi:hypothetical protein